MNRNSLKVIAARIAAGDRVGAQSAIDGALINETGAHWIRDLAKLRATLADGVPRFKILAADGNVKLPFLAFSALPGGANCPGAGECETFCYSYKAWRYPAAFCRQAQNSVLLQTAGGREQIRQAFAPFEAKAAKAGTAMDFRLYVDGDFTSADCVAFWFDFLQASPWINAYGYSKSFAQILEHAANGRRLPANYTLNLSSGHAHDSATVSAMAALTITRGEFVAVHTATKFKQSDYGSREYNQELRQAHLEATGRKAFPCPGRCGDCRLVAGVNVHACGDRAKLTGLDIIISVH